jgi:hypothetical protein
VSDVLAGRGQFVLKGDVPGTDALTGEATMCDCAIITVDKSNIVDVYYFLDGPIPLGHQMSLLMEMSRNLSESPAG